MFKPPNKVFISEAAPPPRATSGEAMTAFTAVAGSTDPATLRDDEQDPMIPSGGKKLDWYAATGDWEVDRNDLGVIIDRYVKAVLQYEHEGKCYWTWQNVAATNMGGGRYGQPKAITMARTREIFRYSCPTGQVAAGAK
jgi:hypothetical protein